MRKHFKSLGAPLLLALSLSLCFCSALYPFSGYLVSLVYIAIITLTYRSTICAIYQSNSTSKLIIIIKFSEKLFSFSSTNWLTDICRSQLTDRQSILYSVLSALFSALVLLLKCLQINAPDLFRRKYPKDVRNTNFAWNFFGQNFFFATCRQMQTENS